MVNLGSTDAESSATPLKRSDSTESNEEVKTKPPAASGASRVRYLLHGFGICSLIGLAVICLTLTLKQRQATEEMNHKTDEGELTKISFSLPTAKTLRGPYNFLSGPSYVPASPL